MQELLCLFYQYQKDLRVSTGHPDLAIVALPHRLQVLVLWYYNRWSRTHFDNYKYYVVHAQVGNLFFTTVYSKVTN